MVRNRKRAFGPASLLLISLGAAAMARSANAAPIKVACIGEHTTHSHAFPADNREAQPPGMQEYPAQLQTLLGPDYEVRNFGDCCGTVLQGYTPQPGETHPYVNGANPGDGVAYKESIAFLPDIVVVGSWGRHDWGLAKAPGEVFTLQGFEDGYDDLIKRYRALASHPKIFVSLPIPILNGQGDVPNDGVKTSDVLPSVMTIASKYGLPVVDLYNPFLNHMELFKQPPDQRGEGEGEHVTAGGLTVMANAVFAAIQKDLQSSGGGGAPAIAGAAGSGGSAGDEPSLGGGGAGSGGSMNGPTGGDTLSGGTGAGGHSAVVGNAGVTTLFPAAGTSAIAVAPTPSSEAGCGCRLLQPPGGHDIHAPLLFLVAAC